MAELLQTGCFPFSRMRRMRENGFSRRLMRENHITTEDLIQPLFIKEGEGEEQISSMPGIKRLAISCLIEKCQHLYDLNIPAVVLFPVIPVEKKTQSAVEAWNDDGLVQQAIRAIKQVVPDIGVITDVALDPYTSHGQDGLVDDKGYVVNDETVDALVKQALSHARAGADIVAPSDMMDGRVRAIRDNLERFGFINTQILAYSAKYASCYFDPFREAVSSSQNLAGENKYSYQMDIANTDEALREVFLDIQEGADIVMIKPGLPYLDIIHRVKQAFGMPTFAYQVSGEYAMLKAASERSWLDEKSAVMETMIAFKRAGSDAVLTYFAEDIATWLKQSG